MIDEYGTGKFIERLSDPYWFQALGCVLAYDWHSSGVTTVVTGVLKTVLNAEDHGVVVCGGKGKTSRKTPGDIQSAGEKWDFSSIHQWIMGGWVMSGFMDYCNGYSKKANAGSTRL
jgi:hypothetical protein